MGESELPAGRWVGMRWRGLRGRGVKSFTAWRKEYIRECLQAVELPECPSAICHHEFKIRQVVIFGCSPPANFRCYLHSVAPSKSYPYFSWALSVSPARCQFCGKAVLVLQVWIWSSPWSLLPLLRPAIIIHLLVSAVRTEAQSRQGFFICVVLSSTPSSNLALSTLQVFNTH